MEETACDGGGSPGRCSEDGRGRCRIGGGGCRRCAYSPSEKVTASAAFGRKPDPRGAKNSPRIRHSLRWQRTRERPWAVVVARIAVVGEAVAEEVVVFVATSSQPKFIHHVRCLRMKAGSAGRIELPTNLAFASMPASEGDGRRWWL